jgi:carbamoyltransferase
MSRISYTVGIHIGHNSASCLFAGQQLLYAEEEERHVSKKDYFGAPWRSLAAALARAGISHSEIGSVGCSWDLEALQRSRRGLALLGCDHRARLWARRRLFAIRFKLQIATVLRQMFPCARFVAVPHHLSHALSVSAFRAHEAHQCAALVMDALAETDSMTAYEFEGSGEIKASLLRWPFDVSLGYFYQRWAEALGFRGRQAPGYMMSLAAFGDRLRYRNAIRNHFLAKSPEGLPWIRPNSFRPAFWRPGNAAQCFPESLLQSLDLKRLRSDSCQAADVAAAVQDLAEEIVLELASWIGYQTGCKSISLSGGVFLNCIAVGKLVKSGLFERVLTGPAAHDGGTAVGAGLHAAGGAESGRGEEPLTPFLGGELNEDQFVSSSGGMIFSPSSPEELARQMVDDLTAGRLIAVADGRLEFGPRALGGRSILGDASTISTVERINLAKKRFRFQPLAASMDAECAGRLFNVHSQEPYMTVAYTANDMARRICPAAVHADGTCRIHIVGAESPRSLQLVLAEMRRRGRLGVVTNTSLNDKGQPLPRTARDVAETLIGLPGVDVLYMPTLRIEKEDLVGVAV